MENVIYKAKFDFLIEVTFEYYIKEYGNIKYLDIQNKVKKSKKINKILTFAKIRGIRLGTNDYLATIMSSSSFIVSKGEVIFIASLIAFIEWKREVGSANFLDDNLYMNEQYFRFLWSCKKLKTHLSSDLNFFDRLEKHLVILF